MRQTINGADFRRLVISAAAGIEINKQKLNELNVFPVPDGDTGTQVRDVNVYIDSMMIG